MVFVCDVAQADSAVIGVATRCDEKSGTFEISPLVDLSSVDPGAVPVKQGFKRLPEGTNKSLCKLGSNSIRTTIRVYGPAARGMCMGSGYIAIDSLRFGKKQLIQHAEHFNWNCINGSILVKLLVRQAGAQSFLERCTAEKWEWGEGFSGIKCTKSNVR